jgi:hypothetical protein
MQLLLKTHSYVVRCSEGNYHWNVSSCMQTHTPALSQSPQEESSGEPCVIWVLPETVAKKSLSSIAGGWAP